MPSRTKVGLNLADKNSYVRVEENINDNLLKIDDDVDATWGGLYGGYIQDETVVKEVGKRYIDKFNKKAYICRKPSNVNTEDAYTECNVVSNLNKLQNLQNSSIKTAEEKMFWESGDGWSADITLQRFAKNGVTTKEIVRINKPAQRGNVPIKIYDIPIPTSSAFPAKYWGTPLGVGTDDPTLAYGGSSVIENPGRILLEFSKEVTNNSPFTISYTWIYNL